MALPVAHTAFALGWTRSRDAKVLLFLSLLAIAPDFDFALVWGLGWPVHDYHRTFSHSLPAALLATGIYWLLRPAWLERVSAKVFFAVVASHAVLDMMCTSDAADHGVQLFWPFASARLGWPVLVPLYRLFAESPFSAEGALRFTALEALLAVFLWMAARGLRNTLAALQERIGRKPTATPGKLIALPQTDPD